VLGYAYHRSEPPQQCLVCPSVAFHSIEYYSNNNLSEDAEQKVTHHALFK